MRRLLQLAWRLLARAWPWGVPAARDPFSPTLLDLPDAAAAVLLAFLDANSLRAVVLCSRDALPPLAHAFQRRFVLRLPPDATRNEVFMRVIRRHGEPPSPIEGQQDDTTVVPLTAHSHAAHDFAASGTEGEPTITQVPSPPTMGLLATQFAVADTDQAADLLPLGPHVRGLVISSNQYTAWPERPFRLDVLGKFIALERLVVGHVWDRPLDLTLLSLSMPQLQELVIRLARAVTGRLTGFSGLRVLHLEATNIDSFAIAVGLPNLQSLTLMTPIHWHTHLCDVACLASVAPLTRLVVRGVWKECPRLAIQKHHKTLREYTEIGDTMMCWGRNNWVPDCPAMVHLRSLRLGRFRQMDMEPLSVLVALEQLQVVVAKTCKHCVPLRRLTRLRELRITNGWVCDLVGYLPRLEKLVWEDLSYPYDAARMTLWCRDGPPPNGSSDAVWQLKVFVLYGTLRIHKDCPSVYKLLQHVEQLEVIAHRRIPELLETISQLRRLKRLAFRRCSTFSWIEQVRQRPVAFACAESLEELYLMPELVSGSHTYSLAPLPKCVHDRLPNLRVLASPYQESMAVLGELCPRLTHVHVPFTKLCSFSTMNRTSLGRLCVVTLAITEDCAWLRRERGPGRALPSLQRIFHTTTDCLSSTQRCERRQPVQGKVPHLDKVFIHCKVLRAPWGHEWEKILRQSDDEKFHRIKPTGQIIRSRQ